MPLSFCKVDVVYPIEKITGKDSMRTHLINLGIVEGESIVIKNAIQKNLIVEIKGIRIALDATLAQRIMVGKEIQ
ncbi:FeoA family protein [Dubosiella newyorkensis]|uniref:FeoA family protein n=1 Tax=Dubosiella newyorkensis TaxID=1862672 RepID=UPI0023F14502|nr:FeoA family protein [Dubosiella newyorkensis]